MGLWFPGAGFIAVGGLHLIWMPVSWLLFALALFIWFASGNVLAPIIVWLGSLMAAAALALDPLPSPAIGTALAMLASAIVTVLRLRRTALDTAREKREQRIRNLPVALDDIEQRACAEENPGNRELSEHDLAATRFLYDRALQPIDQFDGFDMIEQFQPSALRYQIFDMQYTLAHLQCHYTPNFHGYLSQAQRNLIEKVTLPAVWGYWKWESLWGRLSTNFDPVIKDNIMLTGYYLICLNLYAANTGDHRYAQPGALDFRLKSGKRYPHDAHSIAQALVRNYDDSSFCLYPCEPNWIYTFCNLQGMTGLMLYDRVYGSHHVARLKPRFVDCWQEEFTSLDGDVVPIRSSLTGLSIPGLIGVTADALCSVLAGAMLPEIARRMWAQTRSEALTMAPHGRLHVNLTGGDKIDPGNYRKGSAMALTSLLFAAHEYGDDEVARATLARLNTEYQCTSEGGALRYPQMSVFSNSMLIRARITRRGDWRRTVLQGPCDGARTGPVLTGVPYPDVLVARAISTDGVSLDLVLYPGKGALEAQEITIDRLLPQRSYRIEGGSAPPRLVADSDGQLVFRISLAGRTAIRVSTIET